MGLQLHRDWRHCWTPVQDQVSCKSFSSIIPREMKDHQSSWAQGVFLDDLVLGISSWFFDKLEYSGVPDRDHRMQRVYGFHNTYLFHLESSEMLHSCFCYA